jgi:hypothetical protein
MIIKKQLRRLFKERLNFVLMLMLMQTVVIFGIFFLSGVIVNSANVVNEDEYKTLWIQIGFTEPVTYSEIEKTVLGWQDYLLGSIDDIGLVAAEESEKSDSGFITYIANAGIENGKYTLGKNNLRLEKRLEYGRMYTEEELNKGSNVAVAYMYEGEGDESISINGEDYKIIGEVYTTLEGNFPIIYIPVKNFENITISSLDVNLNVVLTQEQVEHISSELDKVISGKYKIHWEQGEIPDSKALAKTILVASAFILLIVLGTMSLLFSYLIRENSYRLGVWKLLGCRHYAAAGLYTLEMALLTAPSLIIGTVSFIIIKNKWLLKMYPYMRTFYTWKKYLGFDLAVFFVVIITIFILSFVTTRGKVRRLLA